MTSSLPTRGAVPETLLDFEQWLCWRAEERDGKPTKVPVDPATGAFVSTTDPETWTGFESAREQVEDGGEDGVGFVFTAADPVVGVDLDACRDPETGAAEEWAREVIETLESYTEVSPSGTGYHVLVTGELPAGRYRRGDLEVYETARFFTVTGEHVEGTPTDLKERMTELAAIYGEFLAPDDESGPGTEPERDRGAVSGLKDEALLQKARNAANGEKFARLWRGDTSGYESHSEADMALCSLLAFWTGGDERQMDRLFRDSGLLREKWDEQHFADGSTYGEKTIERAIAGTSGYYNPEEQSACGPDAAADATLETGELRQREVDRLERIEELQQELDAALEEQERLQAELEAERAKREELEAELAAEREADSSLFSWR